MTRTLQRPTASQIAWSATFVGFLIAASAALAVLPLRVVIALTAAITVGLLTLIRPWLGLLPLAVAIPFGPLWPLPLGLGAADVNEPLIALTVGSWLAAGLATRRIIIPRAPALWAMILLWLAFLASLPGAWSARDGIIELVKWTEGLAIYIVVVAALPPRRARWLAGALLVAGIAQGLLGLYQFWRGIGPAPFAILGRFMRAYGTFRQPNPFGGYMGLVAPLAISLAWDALTGGGWRTSWRERGWLALTLAAAAITVAALIASWSRGAWLGFAAAVAVLVLARGWRTTVAAMLAGLVGFLLLVAVGGVQLPGASAIADRLAGALEFVRPVDPRTVEITDENFALVQRLAQWHAAWGMFSDHPWLGVGIGNYAAAYDSYALPHWYEPLGHAHNYYLNLLAETGLIGFSAYLVLGAALFVWGVSVTRRLTGWRQAWAIGVLATMAHLTVHNAFDNLYVQHIIVHLALVVGLLAVMDAAIPKTTATDAR